MQLETRIHAIVSGSSGLLNNFNFNLASFGAFKENDHQIAQNHPTHVLIWVLSLLLLEFCIFVSADYGESVGCCGQFEVD